MRFDFEETFGDDYLYFYASQLTEEANDRDADDIVRFLGLQAGESVLDAPCGMVGSAPGSPLAAFM